MEAEEEGVAIKGRNQGERRTGALPLFIWRTRMERTCYYCAGPATETHHRVPRSERGPQEDGRPVDVCRACHVQVHAGDWIAWGRMGGVISARMRRMRAGSRWVFREQMRDLARRRVRRAA